MESDLVDQKLVVLARYFYPRSPHGERPVAKFVLLAVSINFYPRSPHGERLPQSDAHIWLQDFYPRSPHGERPFCLSPRQIIPTDFYPRSPHGERRHERCGASTESFISIHALRMESDKGR